MAVQPLARPPYYRQSLIARHDACPLSARFAMEDARRTPGPQAALGTLFHRFAHQGVRQMWRSGEQTLPVEMGLELLLEVICQGDIPAEEVVPISMKGMKWLRVLVTKWCERTQLDATRVLAAEERFFADLPLPDGEVVQISGQTDLLLADPPHGLINIDYKSGFARPVQPRDPVKAENEGTGLTALGWAQWLIYSYLLFATFPSVEYIIFREIHVLWGEERQARMERWQMERLRDVLSAQVALLHQAVLEGPNSPRWVPSAGPHCALCSRPRACPIKDVEGIPATYEEAQRLAQEWIVAGVVRTERRKYLDGWVDAHGPIEVPYAHGRRVVGWDYAPDGKRNFKVFEPQDIPESPYDKILFEAAREHGLAKEDA